MNLYTFTIIKNIFFALILFFAAENVRAQSIRNEEYEVKSLIFTNNDFCSEKLLNSLITTHESPAKISQFFYNISALFGSQAYYYDSTVLKEDIKLIEKHYFDNGFLDVKINKSFRFPSGRDIEIIIDINEGYRYLIDSVFIENPELIEPSLRKEIFEQSVITPPLYYSTELILKEKNRIIQILSNNGYPECYIDNKFIHLFKKLNRNYNLSFKIETGRKLNFGKTVIIQEGEKKQDISDKIFFEQLEYDEGQPYSISKKLESERNISRLGIFDYARIETKMNAELDSSGYVPLYVLFKTRDRYELSPEVFVNNQDFSFNLGLGLSAILRNIGGGAQSISATTRVRAQTLKQGNIDFSLQWLQPYFLTKNLSLNITSSFGLDYRNEYTQSILQNKFGITRKFKEYNFFKYAFFDWDLERAEVKYYVDTTAAAPAVKELFQRLAEPQFNSIFNFTLQHDNTNDPFSPSAGDYISISIAEAGFIPSILIKERAKLNYAQFIKLTIFGKYYELLTPTSIFASKIKIGIAKQYGDEQDKYLIPLTQRFFGGGSGSVRGWRARELGFVARPEYGGKIAIEGNFELREHLFLNKTNLAFLDLSKVWLVLFSDFGNIWDNLKDINIETFAIAGGMGLRYDSVIGPIRIDFGFRVYDPKDPEAHWITGKKIFQDVLAKGQLHFGIGHAF